MVVSSANRLVEDYAFFAGASGEVISCVSVGWAFEYEVMNVFGYTHASDLWTVRRVGFSCPVEVLVDRSVACAQSGQSQQYLYSPMVSVFASEGYYSAVSCSGSPAETLECHEARVKDKSHPCVRILTTGHT